MKTIFDTNIWRKIYEGEITDKSFHNIKSPLNLTFINIDEICKSNLILSDINKARSIIKLMMEMPAINIFEPPLVHLKKLDDPNYQYDIEVKHKDILDISKGIAKGAVVKPSVFQDYINFRKNSISKFADYINDEIKNIRNNLQEQKIKAKNHCKIDTISINRELISKFVYTQTKLYLSNDFDWSKIELFEYVLNKFFNELETTSAKVKPNDIYDLFQLLYLQSGDKFWTMDTKGPLKYVSSFKNEKYVYKTA